MKKIAISLTFLLMSFSTYAISCQNVQEILIGNSFQELNTSTGATRLLSVSYVEKVGTHMLRFSYEDASAGEESSKEIRYTAQVSKGECVLRSIDQTYANAPKIQSINTTIEGDFTSMRVTIPNSDGLLVYTLAE